MLILHLSDIHFRYPACATPESDPERPYRTRLVQDARERVALLGPIEAILVGGDIAFGGAPKEYAVASEWLYELADQVGCKHTRIFVIPGNHDVDRQIIIDNLAVQNAQQAIIRADNREAVLGKQFRHKETGAALLAPLSAYNDFAAPFLCQVYTPERLFWHQDLPLDNSGVHLRIYGLTSTILSGAGAPNRKDDEANDLYLSPLQTVLDPVDNVVNLVMCHHPPDWFMDGDDVADAFKGKASVHILGHKHRQRIDRDPHFVTFCAGAVNPDRDEKGWLPGYNIFRLTLGDGERGYHLNVEAHLLAWQSNPDMFRPILDIDREVFEHRIRLRNIRPPTSATASYGCLASVPEPVDSEAAMGEERNRNIVLRFWNLSSSERREISQKLKLLEDDENRLPEAERYGRALLRAGDKEMLDDLASEIEMKERRNVR